MKQITEEDLRKIAAEVEREYGTGGLSGGTLYEDFAVDVAKRAIAMERERLAAWYAESGWLLDEEDVPDAMRKA